MNMLSPFGMDTEQKDPTSLVWPPTLPIELALKTASPDEIRREYGYTQEEWAALPKNPAFLADLTAACEMVRQEGMSFKLKAKLIAEENLKTAWKMIHANHNDVPPAVKKDLILACARWAGYEQKGVSADGNAAVANNAMQINIHLGSEY